MQLQLFGTLLVCMLLTGVFISKFVHKQSVSEWLAYILFTFIGARIAYVLLTYESFVDTLIRVMYWKQGGFYYWGAAITFLCVVFFMHKRNFLKQINILSAPLSLILFLASWAFLAVPNGYGAVTRSIVGIQPFDFVLELAETNKDLYFHPLFLYSALFWFILYILTNVVKKQAYLLMFISIPIFRILMLYFMARLSFIEYFFVGIWLLSGFLIYFVKTRFKYFN